MKAGDPNTASFFKRAFVFAKKSTMAFFVCDFDANWKDVVASHKRRQRRLLTSWVRIPALKTSLVPIKCIKEGQVRSLWLWKTNKENSACHLKAQVGSKVEMNYLVLIRFWHFPGNASFRCKRPKRPEPILFRFETEKKIRNRDSNSELSFELFFLSHTSTVSHKQSLHSVDRESTSS